MASYTIEDIELIRKKSGISYQEAVALLDYHNGNVARALVDLERNGRIKPENQQKASTSSSGISHNNRGVLSRLFSKFYRFRLKVKKGDIVIANLSLLFFLLALMISPHLVIIAAILVLIPYTAATGGVSLHLLDGTGWLCLLVVGLIHTGVTYCMYFSALKELSGQEASILSYIDPVVAVLLSALVLREHMSLLSGLGAILVLGAAVVSELPSRRKKTA